MALGEDVSSGKKAAGDLRAPRTLDRLAIIDDQGRRTKVQPTDVQGRRERWKPLVRWLCIAVCVVLP